MATVSDETVERVAAAMANGKRITFHERAYARAAIAALSTPEFVLPLAEEMLRGKDVADVWFSEDIVTLRSWEREEESDPELARGDTLLCAYIAKVE